MASKINLTLDQGSDFRVDFLMTDIDGEPANLSVYTGAAQMRNNYTSNVSYDFTVGAYANGVVSLAMVANTTETIPSGTYVYDVELVSSSNAVQRVIEGTIVVTPEVTRV